LKAVIDFIYSIPTGPKKHGHYGLKKHLVPHGTKATNLKCVHGRARESDYGLLIVLSVSIDPHRAGAAVVGDCNNPMAATDRLDDEI
jgi:hypothetical protein